ncbi:hypothetical protein SAMN05192574_102193 [Mucilaginibacter gossypiicola]|uniref:Uncharacterized protein n=1 Tax=Mucilaginibacter gossypiicola TaxID=551995 RepID=A0A1H8D3M7_9SPHI|nr:hypothetical protein [Mucilaginibacter gossypiicola]SEN01796.1 hypothetical protein SAMN05192574_102193 [Mucilaginibacter gossypiicola]
MNWFKFILWLGGIYAAYYLILIAWDHLRNQQDIEGDTNELSFHEQVNAVQLAPELSSADIASPIYASGGVSLKSMFNLCRDEAVEYIKQVSY